MDVLIRKPRPPIPDISDRQFYQALAMRGMITRDEAFAAVTVGTIPLTLDALIAQLPEDVQFAARMQIGGATVFQRSNAFVPLIGQLFGWDDRAADDFWLFAATL